MTIGILLMLANPPLTVASFAFAPQTVVSVTAGTDSMFYTALASSLVGEPGTAHDQTGALLVLTGCIGVGVFGQHATPQYSADQLLVFMAAPRFVVFLICIALWIGLLAALCCLPVEYASRHKSIGYKQKQLAWGCIAGSVGGFWVFLKCTASMIIEGSKPWREPPAYLILLGAVGTSLASVLLLNEGRCRYSGSLITPIYRALMVVMGIGSGAVFFRELDDLGLPQLIGFIVSVVLVCVGTCTSLVSEHLIKPYHVGSSYGLENSNDAS